MAEVPYKLYAHDSGFGFKTLQILPGMNTPYGSQEVDLATFKQIAEQSPQAKAQYEGYLSDPTYKNVLTQAETGQTVGSGWSQGVDPLTGKTEWGKEWGKIAADTAANEAAVAAGTMRKEPLGTGFRYIPIQPQIQPQQISKNLQQNIQAPLSSIQRNLTPGMTGDDVRQLQQYLVSQGYLTQEQMNTGPGIYGPQTTAAVAAWQKASGIDTAGNPGYFGPRSKEYLAGQKYTAPAPDTIVSADTLGGEKPTVPPTAPKTGTTNDASIIGSLGGSTTTGTTSTDPELAKAQEQTRTFTERIGKLYSDLTGKSAYTEQLMAEQGISQKEQDIQNLTNELKQIQTESQTIPIQAQQEAAGRGITAAGLQPLTQAELRANALKALTVSSNLEALQGNLTLALKQIERAVNLKYEPIEQEIEAKKAQLEILDKYTLTPLEEKQKQQMQLAIEIAQDQMKENRSRELSFESDITDAIANGMPISQVSTVRNLYTQGNEDAARVAMAQYTRGSIESLAKSVTSQIATTAPKVIAGEVAPSTYVEQVKQAGGSDIDALAGFITSAKMKFTEKENSALSVLLALDDLAKANPEGEFKGIGIVRLPGILQSEEGRKNRQYIEAINLTTQQWASGAALTEAQTAQVKKFTPDANDTDSQVRDKINGLANYMLTQLRTAAIKSGVQLPVSNINYSFTGLSNNDVQNMDNLLK